MRKRSDRIRPQVHVLFRVCAFNSVGWIQDGSFVSESTTVRTLWNWLVSAYCYHNVMHWGLWTFITGMIARALTFWFDERRRGPQYCATFFWGRIQFLTNPFWSIDVEGQEHLQGGGPFLVCCNHQSLIDSLAMLVIGHQVKFVSHRKVFTAPLLGTMMRACGYVAVDPKNPFPAPDVAREIRGWWDRGESVCLYPEGSRSPDGELQPFKVGGFRLARDAGVPVLPVVIDGTHDIMPKGGLTFRKGAFHKIRVRILPPITADQYGNDALGLCRKAHDLIGATLDDLRGRAPAAGAGARDSGRSMIIIGGGIAGLSAGCYAQMNGFQTRILELHSIPGGLCTSWQRKGYTFDGCVQMLLGLSPGRHPAWHRLWQELGAVQGLQVKNHDHALRIEFASGRVLCVPTDADGLEQELLAFAPVDGKHSRELCAAVRKLARLGPPIEKPRELFGLHDNLKALRLFLPYLPLIHRYTSMSVADYARRYSDPDLRAAWTILYDQPDFPMITAMFGMAFRHNRIAGFPIGGSGAFARSIAERYEQLGGEFIPSSRVEQILVEHDRAVGVRPSANSSGGPAATTCPPSGPPPGPNSISQSHSTRAWGLCSTTITDAPSSTNVRRTSISLATSDRC